MRPDGQPQIVTRTKTRWHRPSIVEGAAGKWLGSIGGGGECLWWHHLHEMSHKVALLVPVPTAMPRRHPGQNAHAHAITHTHRDFISVQLLLPLFSLVGLPFPCALFCCSFVDIARGISVNVCLSCSFINQSSDPFKFSNYTFFFFVLPP